MVHFFPRHTVEWHLHEPAALRRLTLSLVAMAALAGLVGRLYRWLLLGTDPGRTWTLLLALAGGTIILVAMATAHLGNFPVRQWLWRAPLFGLLAGLAEGATSALLLAAGVERIGTDLAHWHEWPGMLLRALAYDILAVVSFALVLGAVVQAVRVALLRREHREHTAQAIHAQRARDAAGDTAER